MIQARLQEIWYGDREPGPLLGALEALYRQSFERRRRRESARRATDLEASPIIVVGNVTVGGTGKTPLVIRLCELLRGAGLQSGVISRGYGRSSKGQVNVTADTPVADSGDEPLLIARRCRVPVVVDTDREAAARAVLAQGVDVVVSDDGLQRWRLPRDIEICVVDAMRGFGNGRLLPAGPLREPATRAALVDHLVSNGGAPGFDAGRESVVMQLQATGWHPVAGGQGTDLEAFRAELAGHSINAIAGIGHPQRFFDDLAKLGIRPDHQHSFDDHHDYRLEDFEHMDGVLLMTEKDAMKCATLGLDKAWFLRVDACLPQEWERQVTALALALVERKSQ